MKIFSYFICILISLLSCNQTKKIVRNQQVFAVTIPDPNIKAELFSTEIINDTTFVNLRFYSKDFAYDMKYATADNFLKAKVYECADCYLRFKTIKALIKANGIFMKMGYKIKIFDCYRPLDIQKKMWKIVPNPIYVADPKKGSIHNRGGAVDITLVDSNQRELNMGTQFDHFGIEASHNYLKLSDTILKNRLLLKKVMTENNFTRFDSEWWHYNLNDSSKDKVSNFRWKCE